jgi:argininosuccinate lyase
MASKNKNSLWGSRFSAGPSPEMANLSKSTHFDWRLAKYDLLGSKAHAEALAAKGYLNEGELKELIKAIDQLESRVEAGSFKPKPTDEDVHSALERGLIQIAGQELGGKLRAGRSRNDQIATEIRLFMLDAAKDIQQLLVSYIEQLTIQAETHMGVAMPGRTHFQHAQPVLLAHHLLAHAWPQFRNLQRLEDWRTRANQSPYGAGALAGSSLGLDPKLVAEKLGMGAPERNSMDATSSRDAASEFLFICAQIGIDLSRFSEELIIWSSAEFDYVKLSDEFSTGSSIMPQKKNPDIAELTRGKTGRLIGNLTSLLTTLKGLPLSYNRDLQEDKEPVFDSVDSLLLVMPALNGMIKNLAFNTDRLEKLAPEGFSLATDVAEWLVRQGVPFKNAHDITGRMVSKCEQLGVGLADLSDKQLAEISPELKPAVREVLTVSGSIKSRDGIGGTALNRVLDQLMELRKIAPRTDLEN